ncbi:recombinase family protein [Pyramidobacter sp. SM-530-WT-4B]|uniref:Recombinase family protein n=1 Tax=Pyramidobacter porci TaxID=2605789 RepID=A0A6L5YC86_9BACT|nr:recombinase family protein [Pyramidobacter porci]MST55668.1 recombinase family protein [Pyramidobacter porci]
MSARRARIISNTAVIYARYSSTNQREESIEAQVRACQEYAKRNGLVIVDIYADSAKTGTNAEREEFQRMIADSATGKFEFVIVHKLDRFSRDRYDSIAYKRKLKLNGVTLRSVLENLDGSPESLILESLLEGMAAYYSQNLAREALKGMKENGYRCMHNGGIPPYGYDVDKETRKYVINEEEAMVVRYIFSSYADGVGYNQIIRYLNANGYRSKRGNPFGKNSIHDLLKNIRYTGIYTFNLRKEKDAVGNRNHRPKSEEERIMIEGGMPAIIDKDTFDRVQMQIRRNKRLAACEKAHEPYLLSGLIYCGECKGTMWGSRIKDRHGNITRFYVCSTRDYKKHCDNRSIRKEVIEGFVLAQLERDIFSHQGIEKLRVSLILYRQRRQATIVEEKERLISEGEEIKHKIQKIVELVSQSGITIGTVSDEIKLLEEKRRQIADQIDKLNKEARLLILSQRQLEGMKEHGKEVKERKNLKKLRQIISYYVESVAVYHDRIEITYKFALPDKQADGIIPMTVVRDLAQVKEEFKAPRKSRKVV